MFPVLTLVLADLGLPGAWPRMLRGYALEAGEDAAVDLARWVARWAEGHADAVAAERARWGHVRWRGDRPGGRGPADVRAN